MLAAAPKVPHSQELFKLVLNLISSETDVPLSLKEYFITVLLQAKNLTKTSEIPQNILPESIDLAFEIKTIKGLSESLKNIDKIENVSPDLANKLLASMEQYSVY